MDRSLLPSPIKLYIRQKNVCELPEGNLIDVEQLEKIYLSATIQEIFIICVDDPQLTGKDRLRYRLAAVVVSEAQEMTVLEELETIGKEKQLRCFEIPWAVIVEREPLYVANRLILTPSNKIDRQTLEKRYRTEIVNILLVHQGDYEETTDCSVSAAQQHQTLQCRLLMEIDQMLDSTIQPFVETNKKTCRMNIFLTGSTGFLGAYLLSELLKHTDANIYCLVRKSTSARTLQPRVFYLEGDLTHRQLGLDDHQYSMLVSNIYSIYHCGAAVNFVKPYAELRAANVLGTIEIIKLACLANARVNYISTLDVVDQSNHNGYVQSKRVAEHLMEQARERYLLVSILRPGKTSSMYHHSIKNTP
jgi:hypothetical protein